MSAIVLRQRILGALGLGSALAMALVPSSSCCPPLDPEDFPARVVVVSETCTLQLDALEDVGELCHVEAGDVDCDPIEEVGVRGAPAECLVRRVVEAKGGDGGGGTWGGGLATGGAAAGGSSSAGGASTGGSAPTDVQTRCCYAAPVPLDPGGCGRPFIVAGQAQVPPVIVRGACASNDSLSAAHLRALADHWTRDAQLEHASVAAFARLVLDLLALGAPAALIAEAQQAMADELDHAQRCFALASRYEGATVEAGPWAIPSSAPADRLELALRTLYEGCIGETVAARLAEEARSHATDPEVRETLAIIARDEAAHAVTSYRILAWACRDPDVLAAIQLEVEQLVVGPATALVADDAELAGHGLVDRPRRAIAQRAMADVVRPCLDALLAA